MGLRARAIVLRHGAVIIDAPEPRRGRATPLAGVRWRGRSAVGLVGTFVLFASVWGCSGARSGPPSGAGDSVPASGASSGAAPVSSRISPEPSAIAEPAARWHVAAAVVASHVADQMRARDLRDGEGAARAEAAIRAACQSLSGTLSVGSAEEQVVRGACEQAGAAIP